MSILLPRLRGRWRAATAARQRGRECILMIARCFGFFETYGLPGLSAWDNIGVWAFAARKRCANVRGEHMTTKRLLRLFLLAAAGAFAPSAPALADCVSDCQASTYCDSAMNASGECGRALNQCYLRECKRPTRLFGAIAYGAESEAYGFAYDLPDANAANKRALVNCAKNGKDCKIVSTFSNGCAAVAAAGKRFSVVTASTGAKARADAMAACGKGGAGACEVKVWSCAMP